MFPKTAEGVWAGHNFAILCSALTSKLWVGLLLLLDGLLPSSSQPRQLSFTASSGRPAVLPARALHLLLLSCPPALEADKQGSSPPPGVTYCWDPNIMVPGALLSKCQGSSTPTIVEYQLFSNVTYCWDTLCLVDLIYIWAAICSED